MQQKKIRRSVLGVGSALVDVLIRLNNDSLLDSFGLLRGSMTLVDATLSQKILDFTSGLPRSLETGGSAANTIRVIGQLKGQAGFWGKVGTDEMGVFFREEMEKLGVDTHLFRGNLPTGKAATLISPDSERTFGTYLGAASELSAADLPADVFGTYDYLHVEGYLVFNRTLIEKILQMAKDNCLTVSLDMASYNVVEATRDFMRYLVDRYVDIVFANEEEAFAYTGLEPEDALEAISGQCGIAVVKKGEKGSLIRSGGEQFVVEAPRVESIDTNGAGDVYAGGFLYGLANGFTLRQCGALGSLLASEVVQVYGAKIPETRWPSIEKQIALLVPGAGTPAAY